MFVVIRYRTRNNFPTTVGAMAIREFGRIATAARRLNTAEVAAVVEG